MCSICSSRMAVGRLFRVVDLPNFIGDLGEGFIVPIRIIEFSDSLEDFGDDRSLLLFRQSIKRVQELLNGLGHE